MPTKANTGRRLSSLSDLDEDSTVDREAEQKAIMARKDPTNF